MREILKRSVAALVTLIAASSFALVAGSGVAIAQEEAAAPPELIQAVKSEKLGSLKLPAFWSVEDTADGVRAVEGNTDNPASIEVAILPIPERLSGDSIVDALVADLSPRLAELKVEKREAIPEKDGVARTFVVITGKEGEHEVRYAILLLLGNRMGVFAALGSPADRFESLAPRELLTAVLESIRAD